MPFSGRKKRERPASLRPSSGTALPRQPAKSRKKESSPVRMRGGFPVLTVLLKGEILGHDIAACPIGHDHARPVVSIVRHTQAHVRADAADDLAIAA